jgi:hypothetical protein
LTSPRQALLDQSAAEVRVHTACLDPGYRPAEDIVTDPVFALKPHKALQFVYPRQTSSDKKL